MDGRKFDDVTRMMPQSRSRRAVLKGLFGLSVAAVATAKVGGGDADAAWSTLICLPIGNGEYTERLVPTASVPFYVQRYGAIPAENGACPCVPDSIEHACASLCGGTVSLGCGITVECPAVCGGTCFGDCPEEGFTCFDTGGEQHVHICIPSEE